MRDLPNNDAIAIFGIVVFAVGFIDALIDGDLFTWVDFLANYLACGLCAGMGMMAMHYSIKISEKREHGKNKDNQ